MEHVKSKGIDLQNSKTFKDSKHKEHKAKPNPQSLANLKHHMKNQTLHTNIKPRNEPRKILETNPQIRETQKQTNKFQTQKNSRN